MKITRFRPPVMGIGDEFEYVRESYKKPPANSEVLIELADSYEETARSIRRLAGAMIECPELEIDPGIDSIYVEGPEDRLAELTRQGLLETRDLDDEPAEAIIFVADQIRDIEDERIFGELSKLTFADSTVPADHE